MSTPAPGPGLFTKYEVVRSDGNPKHAACRYFVLDPQHDRLAIHALLTYADKAEEQGNRDLAEDLRNWVFGILTDRGE